jgi:alpha-L-rhamnosidase
MNSQFLKAKAIWAKDKAKEMNVTCLFTVEFKNAQNLKLNITASSFYRLFLNGKLIGYGPARAAHGYFRIDEYKLENLNNDNFILIEVVGYNTNSFYSLNQPSFIQAEILSSGKVIKATDNAKDFNSYIYPERIQKVLRFSYQRPFSESYNLIMNPTELYKGNIPFEKTETEEVITGKYLTRDVGYPLFPKQEFTFCEYGKISVNEEIKPYRDRFMSIESLGIYKLDELEINTNDIVCKFEYSLNEKSKYNGSIAISNYCVYGSNRSVTGFIGLDIKAIKNSKIFVIFDEVDSGNADNVDQPKNINFFRNTTNNIISYNLKSGNYNLISFEPYTAKYIKIIVTNGEIIVNNVSIIKYENADAYLFEFKCQDKKLKSIVSAAQHTFSQNAVDLLTDCPSRERAGWLCDSYFSSQAEKLFTGKNEVEHNFLYNYMTAPQSDALPKGMIEMCYPSEVEESGAFIPNWSMWYIVELKYYLLRTKDRELIENSRKKVEGVLNYFKKFENEDGLLENLESWVFIEWSKANEFISGVNYPSNMLYSKALKCAYELYNEKEYLVKADNIIDKIKEQSYNGDFFEDNRIRKDGKLTKTGNTSETCQYYAFYFDIASPENYPELFKKLTEDFGPNRDFEKFYPLVFKSNAFIGNYLRLDYFLKHGFAKQAAAECKDYFYKMAVLTGTLWEHDSIFASLNHCFASYVTNIIIECVSGFIYTDNVTKKIYMKKPVLNIDFSVKIPLNNHFIKISGKNGNLQIEKPKEYEIIM